MKKYLTFSFLTAAFLGMLKILSIVPFDRMSADDFNYTTLAVSKGLLQAQISWYVTFTGKFTTNFLVSVFGILSSGNGKTSVYFIITLLAVLGAFYYFFKNLSRSQINRFFLIILSLVLVSAYYLITPDKNESWYWLSGSVAYLWATILGLYAISVLLSKEFSKKHYILSFLLTFFAVGNDEAFGFLTLCFLFIVLLFLFIKNYLENRKESLFKVKVLLFNNLLFKKILIVFLAAVFSFAIIFVAPGNAKRLDSPASSPMSLFGAVLYSIQTGPSLIYAIYKHNVIFLTSLVFVLSSFFAIEGLFKSKNLPSRESLLRKIFFAIVIPVLLSIIFILPGYRALGRVLPSRAEVLLAFVVLMSAITVSYYLAQLILATEFNKKFHFKIFVFGSSLIFFASSLGLISTLASDVYIAKNYSQAFDNMFIQLTNVSKDKKDQIIQVPELPESGLIHSEKLTTDPNHWANKPISNFFGLKGITILENEEVK